MLRAVDTSGHVSIRVQQKHSRHAVWRIAEAGSGEGPFAGAVTAASVSGGMVAVVFIVVGTVVTAAAVFTGVTVGAATLLGAACGAIFAGRSHMLQVEDES